MKSLMLAMFVATCITPAWAVNKCTVGGQVVFQDAPCGVDAKKSETVKVWDSNMAATQGKARQLPFKPVALSQQQIAQATKEVNPITRSAMKDPESVKLQGVRVFGFESLDRVYVMTCGELNAKNSYGGYVGMKPFWIYDGVFTQTFNHFLPTDKTLSLLMGAVQTECLAKGTQIEPS